MVSSTYIMSLSTPGLVNISRKPGYNKIFLAVVDLHYEVLLQYKGVDVIAQGLSIMVMLADRVC